MWDSNHNIKTSCKNKLKLTKNWMISVSRKRWMYITAILKLWNFIRRDIISDYEFLLSNFSKTIPFKRVMNLFCKHLHFFRYIRIAQSNQNNWNWNWKWIFIHQEYVLREIQAIHASFAPKYLLWVFAFKFWMLLVLALNSITKSVTI